MKRKLSGPIEKVKIVLCGTKEASAASAAVIRERMVEVVLKGGRWSLSPARANIWRNSPPGS